MSVKTPQNVSDAIKKLNASDQVIVQTFIAGLKSTIQDLQAKLAKLQGHDHEHHHDHATCSSDHHNHSHHEETVGHNHHEEERGYGDHGHEKLEFPPMYESGENYDQASTYKIEAGDLKAEGKYSEALEKYTLAICAAPPSALLLANRADTLYHLSRFQAAIKDCTAALDQNPDSAKALRIRGRCYKELGQYELSRKDLSAAQAIDYEEGGVVQDLKFVTEKCLEVETKRAHERVQEEERLREKAERIRKAREEQAKREAEEDEEFEDAPSGRSFPGAGGMGGGFPGAGGIPAGAMGMMSQLFSDPEIAEGLKNPKVMAAMSKLMSNPAGAMSGMSSLMNDPEVAPIMKKIMAKMGPLFGGMGGSGGGVYGGHGDGKYDDNDEEMPDLDMPDIH